MILDSNRKDVYQSFTENEAVINGEMVQICCSISQPRFNVSKNPSVKRCKIWCRLLNFFQIVIVGLKKLILVMLSRIVTSCKSFQILICSSLWMKSLHTLSKFHGYIFNGLGEK